MTVTKLVELRDQISQHLVERRKTLEIEMAHLNNYINGGRKVAGKRSPLVGVKVKPKYRGPKGETWAGRGVYPTWLAALLKEGHKLQEFAIGAAKPAAAVAHKKVARKSSRKPAGKVKAARKKG